MPGLTGLGVGTSEHACLRCPVLQLDPKMLPRLEEIEVDLLGRRARVEAENWLGEIEGIDLTLTFLRGKRDETRRLVRVVPVDLGIPQLASITRSRPGSLCENEGNGAG